MIRSHPLIYELVDWFRKEEKTSHAKIVLAKTVCKILKFLTRQFNYTIKPFYLRESQMTRKKINVKSNDQIILKQQIRDKFFKYCQSGCQPLASNALDYPAGRTRQNQSIKPSNNSATGCHSRAFTDAWDTTYQK
ncbi:hypothetical protein BpHYR1_037227 [Brachionus plicatilis]|uniref:Uncharacterized protein n=1 Tax=Brachionus plicatilis TaxID=10195 RepID=A0A3M7PRX4_BRAPC|nr:hypothetical protein BpHYR1_037227 [Brachionus plicatilis]